MFGTKVEKKLDFRLGAAIGPRHGAGSVPGGDCDQMAALLYDPDWNPPTSETSYYAEGSIVRAHHHCTGRDASSSVRRTFHQFRNCRCGHHSFYEPLGDGTLPRIPRVNASEANSVPATNRMSGPKLQAAGAPRKCRPGTDDWNPASSCG